MLSIPHTSLTALFATYLGKNVGLKGSKIGRVAKEPVGLPRSGQLLVRQKNSNCFQANLQRPTWERTLATKGDLSALAKRGRACQRACRLAKGGRARQRALAKGQPADQRRRRRPACQISGYLLVRHLAIRPALPRRPLCQTDQLIKGGGLAKQPNFAEARPACQRGLARQRAAGSRRLTCQNS